MAGARMYQPDGIASFRVAGKTYLVTANEGEYLSCRDFTAEPVGPDSGPEGLEFVGARKSPSGQPLLLVAHEVTGTVAIWEASDPAETTLSLLHNNDGESSLLPLSNTVNPGTGYPNTSAVNLAVAGVAAFKTVTDREIRDARGLGNAVLNVYAGDSFLASATLACSLPPEPESTPIYDAVAQRRIAYDAHVFGNHEFDYGPDFLERFIRQSAVGGVLDQPFLSANLDFGAEPGYADLIDADGLIEGETTDGRVVARSAIVSDPTTAQRFGIIGATTPTLPTISTPRDVTVTPDLESTAEVIQAVVINVARGSGSPYSLGVRSGETNGGNLVTDSYIVAYDEYAANSGLPPRDPVTDPVIAVNNGGGIRQNAGNTLPQGGAPGVISRLDTLNVLSFDNFLVVAEDVSAADLKIILERSCSSIGGGQFLQIAHFEMTCDVSEPVGSRVSDVIFTNGTTTTADDFTIVDGGGAAQAVGPFGIATNQFTGNGGDDYPTFAAATKTTLLTDAGEPIFYEQSLREYLGTFPAGGSPSLPTIPASDERYAAQSGEGRITLVGLP